MYHSQSRKASIQMMTKLLFSRMARLTQSPYSFQTKICLISLPISKVLTLVTLSTSHTEVIGMTIITKEGIRLEVSVYTSELCLYFYQVY